MSSGHVRRMLLTSKLAALAIATIAFATGLCSAIGTESAWAANPRDISALQGNVNMMCFQKASEGTRFFVDYPSLQSGKVAISDAKSSKPNVASIRAYYSSDLNTSVVEVIAKKAGTTRITYTLNGAKKSAKVKVYKYSNPMKLFKIGKTDLTDKFRVSPNPDGDSSSKTSGLSGKVKIRASKGWAFTNMLVNGWSEMKEVGNGYKLGKYEWLQEITMRHKKSGLEVYLRM